VHCASLSSKPTASQQSTVNSKQQAKPGLLGKLINRFLGRPDESITTPAPTTPAAAAPPAAAATAPAS
jgi:hypothetical protein